MPDDRPMPLTGEEAIEPHPTLGEAQDNFPSRRMVVLVRGWSVLIGLSLLVNIGVWNVEADWLGPLLVGIFGTLATVIGWWVLDHWNREVILYERGFTYREGSKNIPFRYSEIAKIRLRAETLSTFGGLLRFVIYDIRLVSGAGDVIRLNNLYRRAGVMGDKLMSAVYTSLRPALEIQLDNGEAVPFSDALRVRSDGLVVDASALEDVAEDAYLSWGDFGGYRVQQRQLQLLTRAGALWVAFPLHEVDNLLLLLELLRTHAPQTEENRP